MNINIKTIIILIKTKNNNRNDNNNKRTKTKTKLKKKLCPFETLKLETQNIAWKHPLAYPFIVILGVYMKTSWSYCHNAKWF